MRLVAFLSTVVEKAFVKSAEGAAKTAEIKCRPQTVE
jgi:hypothetical protein